MADFLTRLGTYASTNGSEIPAYDPGSKRLFVVAGPVVEILDITNPATPRLVSAITANTSQIPLPAGFTAVPNSVAVRNGIVAVSYAIANTTTNEQASGQVQFFNTNGVFQRSVQVGALPDMLTFTPDGTRILTANEGEPRQDYQVDPEGSVSIIDLRNGVANATVRTAGFTQYNSQLAQLRQDGVRIFGRNATVAQDLEPEYIAFSGDGTKAWVTLQENNAIAIVDIATAQVERIVPLGYKNHNTNSTFTLDTYNFFTSEIPAIGSTAAGQPIPLGGFSGLTFEGKTADGKLKFITHTDRGPNGEPTGVNRPFLLPNFTPRIIRFELDPSSGQIAITQQINLRTSTRNLTGVSNTAITGGTGNTPYNDEVPVDLRNNVLPLDPLGADLEGIVVGPNGNFWMVDEYRPAIYQFSPDGVLIERFVPIGTAAAAGQPAGTYGTEVLPTILAQRRQNRGFEAVALEGNKLYAFVQSPLRNPASLSNSALNDLNNIRIVEFDIVTRATRQFLYRLDNPATTVATDTRADKIGDAVALGNGEFLVLERDDDAIDSDPASQIEKKVYRFSLGNATDVSSITGTFDVGGGVLKSIDQMTPTELAARGINPIAKTLYVDLTAVGYNQVEKVEGLALIDSNTIAVINDNDFTVGSITVDATTGRFTRTADPEPILLGIIQNQTNRLDASDRDNRINIQNWPVFGMYQPDSIASYTVGGQTYYITANEGDSRAYTGFNEEVRVGAASYVLDPTKFPNAATLKQNANLGRLQVTNALGDTDGDGDFDEIYVYGARSFSIWDSTGKLVFDSGDELERRTAALYPNNFNASNDNNTLDDRSDNKGPEPEGVAVGTINGRTYAFIGLERIGGVMVYDVTDPIQPSFIQYINPRDFTKTPALSTTAGAVATANVNDAGPEGLLFIAAKDSPTGKPLLAVSNEISGTTSIFEITPPNTIPLVIPTLETTPALLDRANTADPVNSEGDADDPAIYLNPTDPNKSLVITAVKNAGIRVYDLSGNLVQTINPGRTVLNPNGIRYNNVDLQYGFRLGNQTIDFAVATDRRNDRIAIFRIDPNNATAPLTDITDPNIGNIFGVDASERHAYGIALYRSPLSGKSYVFVNRRTRGEVAQLELFDAGNGRMGARRVRSFTVPTPSNTSLSPQLEGMVVDQELGFLYIGQEDFGIWKYGAEPNSSSTGTLIDTTREAGGRNLRADVEGLTIYYTSEGKGYLLASSQGDNTFAVYTREGNNTYLGSFEVGNNSSKGIDSVQQSDGADVINVPLGSAFPFGLFVTQDGFNAPIVQQDDGTSALENVSTNFKYVGWQEIAAANGLAIDTTSYNPRTPAGPDRLITNTNNLLSVGGVPLLVTLTQKGTNRINEIGAFLVDDERGAIGSLLPGQSGYLQTALQRSQTVLSVLPDNFLTNPTRLLNFSGGARLVFFLVQNSTTEQVLADLAAGQSTAPVLFAPTFGTNAFQQARISGQVSTGGLTLRWEDELGGGDQDFDDAVITIRPTDTASTPGTSLQGGRERELLDLRSFTGRVAGDFVVNSEAAYNNTVGFYTVDAADGAIGNLRPGDAGYAQAAIQRRVVTTQRDTNTTFQFSGGSILAPFIIANGTVDQFLSLNPSNQAGTLAGTTPVAYFAYLGANPDRFDHVRLLGDNKFGFEDLPNGGDRDFNDIVLQVNNIRSV